VRFDVESNTYWFRQSWLGDALGCNERGRRKIIQPDWDWQGDAAAAGTAAHAAVQLFIIGLIHVEELGDEAERIALDYVLYGVPDYHGGDPKPIIYKSFENSAEMVSHARRCAEAWGRDLLPDVTLGGLTEVPFQVPLYRRDSGRGVGIEGTVDYAPPIDFLLDDWKNPGRSYKQWEKQRSDIQATTYCVAAVRGGFDSAWEEAGMTPPLYQWPMKFRFGVAVRGTKQAKGEFVPVMRGRGHELWLHHILDSFVDMDEVMGHDRSWIVNPTYSLCSEKWCPWWSDCQGKYLTTEQHTWKP